LWRVVYFKAISLKVPQEVSSAQAIRMRFIALLAWLRSGWCRGCLLPVVVVDLPDIDWLLPYGWSSCSEFLLSTYRSFSVGILALLVLFIRFSILRSDILGEGQDLTI
jgi:uncharacterized membrane protein